MTGRDPSNRTITAASQAPPYETGGVRIRADKMQALCPTREESILTVRLNVPETLLSKPGGGEMMHHWSRKKWGFLPFLMEMDLVWLESDGTKWVTPGFESRTVLSLCLGSATCILCCETLQASKVGRAWWLRAQTNNQEQRSWQDIQGVDRGWPLTSV